MVKATPYTVARATALSLASMAGSASAAPLLDLPTEVLRDVVDNTKGAEEQQASRSASASPASDEGSASPPSGPTVSSVWPSAAPEGAEELRRLARDASDNVRISAAVALARAVERASAPARIDLVCAWALSPDKDERLALARALTWSTPVFIADLVLEQLAADESTAVRAAALAAVAKHFHEDSSAYARIVSKCVDDPDANVRRLARALLQRASA